MSQAALRINPWRLLPVLALCGLLAACGTTGKGGRYYEDDGPPRFRKGPNPDRVPDAVPRNEPLSRTGNSPYTALGKRFVPMREARGFSQTGYASWYGRKYHGNRTSSGEEYDMYAMTAAHPVLPLPSYVRVRNLANNREVTVKVNDRGPFLNDRIIDLSYMAAKKLGVVETGTAKVKIHTVFAGDTPRANRQLAAAPAAAPVAVAAGGSFMLQAGSFGSPANAEMLVRRLESGGYGNVRVQQVTVSGRNYHRVQVGPYPDRRSAELIAATLEDFLRSPVSVVAAGAG